MAAAWRLLVTGGGTGGHIYPAVAAAQRAVTAHGPVEVLYVGSRGGLEEEFVRQAGLPFKALAVSGLIRKSPVEKVQAAGRFAEAVWAALRIVWRFRPDVVLDTGGYAAAPVAAAAVLLRKPLVLQEQNVIPGVTNRLFSRFATGVAVPYEDARRYFPPRANLWIVGNPVRPEVLGVDKPSACARLALSTALPTVVLYGGSRGSAVFVRLFRELLPVWEDTAQLLFISGEAHHASAAEVLSAAGSPSGVHLLPYVHAMGDVLAAADLAVTRAGGMTLAELAACGRPAVIIPSPYVTHHHQEANAAVFARAGAGLVLAEAGLDGRRLAETVRSLLSAPERLEAMAAAARGLGRAEALDDLVGRLCDVARRRRIQNRPRHTIGQR